MVDHAGAPHRAVDFAPRSRAGLNVRVEALTWQHALFAVEAANTTVYVLRDQREAGAFLDDFGSGRLDRELRALLERPPHSRLTRRRARRTSPRARTGTLVGLEHEFSIFDGSTRVDFRTLIHALAIEGVRADPSDPNAYRCPWGGVITCDGREAEIAIPPVEVSPGFVRRAFDYADRGEASLRDLVPGHRLDGYSSHISVSFAERNDRRAARRYARTFAPAMMLLMDRASSPGLLVRPRPGRLELCGEHVSGAVARGALAFAVGSVRALVGANRRALGALRVRVRLEPAIERYGIYVDRRAFGPDLYTAGRAAELRTRDGAPRSAQQQLELAWTLARQSVAADFAEDDLDAIDRMVRNEIPLPCEMGV
ncbi:MAG: hypothetical protein QOG65_2612 [Actinomycetota bacterium]|jgi:hypothetical protein|nr:hypothetical protein [Actinomycetota bacterium]